MPCILSMTLMRVMCITLSCALSILLYILMWHCSGNCPCWCIMVWHCSRCNLCHKFIQIRCYGWYCPRQHYNENVKGEYVKRQQPIVMKNFSSRSPMGLHWTRKPSHQKAGSEANPYTLKRRGSSEKGGTKTLFAIFCQWWKWQIFQKIGDDNTLDPSLRLQLSPK